MNYTPFLLFILLFCHCSSSKESAQNKQEYTRWVGDIPFDQEIDDPDFTLCHGEKHVRQYFNFNKGFQYDGEKEMLIREFNEKYIPVANSENGLIRIRFIVNCKGETGRFRMIQMNNDYVETVFDEGISSQLLAITKGLKGWKALPSSDHRIDYYQYLIFRIENGQLKEILP